MVDHYVWLLMYFDQYPVVVAIFTNEADALDTQAGKKEPGKYGVAQWPVYVSTERMSSVPTEEES
jgi:hypothetical protein